MLKMRTSKRVSEIDPKEKNQQEEAVLVCITKQQSCKKLIHKGAMIAKEKNLKLLVFSVQPKNSLGIGGGYGILEDLFRVSAQYGSEMWVYYNDNPIDMANYYLKRNNVTHCVTGIPSADGQFVENLIKNHPEIQLHFGSSEKDGRDKAIGF